MHLHQRNRAQGNRQSTETLELYYLLHHAYASHGICHGMVSVPGQHFIDTAEHVQLVGFWQRCFPALNLKGIHVISKLRVLLS